MVEVDLFEAVSLQVRTLSHSLVVKVIQLVAVYLLRREEGGGRKVDVFSSQFKL